MLSIIYLMTCSGKRSGKVATEIADKGYCSTKGIYYYGLKQRVKAADDLFSTAVSKIRQPIEALFNWLIHKANIQDASLVRSSKGLMVHAFSKLAGAFIYLAF